MKRRSSILDGVQVKTPCREDWNEMRGNSEVRFCSHCQKSVHNLSQMTRRDAERLVAKSNGRLCVRYVTRAETIVTQPAPQTLHNITRRVSRVAASAFTAALTLTTAAAQNSATPNHSTANVEATANKENAPQIPNGSAMLVGTIFDTQQAVIPNAKITLTDASTGFIQVTQSDEEGNYRFYALADGSYALEVEANGFARFKANKIFISKDRERRANLTLEVAVVGEIITVAPPL